MIVYGLKACDTCRKALKSSAGAVLRDVRAEPLSASEINRFLAELGDALVNRRSATWRGLGEAERSEPAAVLLARFPALMKRPVIEQDGTLRIGV